MNHVKQLTQRFLIYVVMKHHHFDNLTHEEAFRFHIVEARNGIGFGTVTTVAF